jgi:two-component system response regulator HydG
MLTRHFIDRYSVRHGRPVGGLTDEAMACLQGWTWPGNVRELENTIERAVVLCRTDTIHQTDLPPSIATANRPPDRLSFAVGTPLRVIERRMIETTLKKCDGDRNRTAALLGTTIRTLYRREAEWRSGK